MKQTIRARKIQQKQTQRWERNCFTRVLGSRGDAGQCLELACIKYETSRSTTVGKRK